MELVFYGYQQQIGEKSKTLEHYYLEPHVEEPDHRSAGASVEVHKFRSLCVVEVPNDTRPDNEPGSPKLLSLPGPRDWFPLSEIVRKAKKDEDGCRIVYKVDASGPYPLVRGIRAKVTEQPFGSDRLRLFCKACG